MIRLAYRLYRFVSATRHWLTRRLTPAGWLALTGLVLSGAIGVDLDQSVAGQAFAVLFCLLVVSRLAALFFRGRFSAERLLPRLGSAGQPFAYRVRVRNHSARAWRDLELLEDLADPRPTLEQFIEMTRSTSLSRSFRLAKKPAPHLDHRVAVLKPVPLPTLTPKGEAEAHVEVLPLKRGPLRFVGLTIARRDPLGLFRGCVRLRSPQTVLILPRRYPLPPIALPGAHKYQLGGVALAASVGESEEFVSLRDYRPGDPLRHVHWRSTARVGRPIVKEFEDEFFVRHALILDTFAGPDMAPAFEEAVSLAASFACTVDTQESLLDLMFVGPQAVCFTAGRGVGHAEQALEILAAVQPCRSRPFTALQALVLQHAPVVSGCICILLAWDEPRRELIRKLTALGLPLLVLVVTDAATARQVTGETEDDRPSDFHVFAAGRIEEGLLRLGRTAA
jgi:uncharacterized protein (DUF58 family)